MTWLEKSGHTLAHGKTEAILITNVRTKNFVEVEVDEHKIVSMLAITWGLWLTLNRALESHPPKYQPYIVGIFAQVQNEWGYRKLGISTKRFVHSKKYKISLY